MDFSDEIMNGKMIIGGIIVIVIIAAGVLSYTYFDSQDNTEEFESEDMNLGGEWETDLLFTFADGSTKKLSDLEKGLSVYFNDQKVDYVTWTLSAEASTPDGADAYENCEFSFYDIDTDGNDFSLLFNAEHDTIDDNIINRVYSPLDDGPVQDVVIPVDGSKNELWSKQIDLNSVFDKKFEGSYTVKFLALNGPPKYRGSSTDETGNWQTDGDIPTPSFTVEVVGSEVTVNFDAGIEWN
jgi:hypothetical protein